MTVAAGIIDVLIAAGVGSLAPAPVWPIYEGDFPDDGTDECLMVRETGGLRPEARVAIDYPSVQVLVRGDQSHYPQAADKADEVKLALHGIPSGPAEMPTLSSCLLMGEKTFAGYDELKRPIWTCNFNCIISKNPEGYRDQ